MAATVTTTTTNAEFTKKENPSLIKIVDSKYICSIYVMVVVAKDVINIPSEMNSKMNVYRYYTVENEVTAQENALSSFI